MALESGIADLTPTFCASDEHDATTPFVILAFCLSVIITACAFPFSIGSRSSSHDG